MSHKSPFQSSNGNAVKNYGKRTEGKQFLCHLQSSISFRSHDFLAFVWGIFHLLYVWCKKMCHFRKLNLSCKSHNSLFLDKSVIFHAFLRDKVVGLDLLSWNDLHDSYFLGGKYHLQDCLIDTGSWVSVD